MRQSKGGGNRNEAHRQQLQRLHQRRWRSWLGLTNLPGSTDNERDPNLNCTKARSLVMLIGGSQKTLIGAANPMMICAQLGPLRRTVLRDTCMPSQILCRAPANLSMKP